MARHRRRRVAAPERDHREVGGDVRDRDGGAELEEGEALQKIGGGRGGGIEEKVRVEPDDEEIREDLALGRQQGAIAGSAFGDRLDVAGDEAVEKGESVGPCDAKEGTAGGFGGVEGRHAWSPSVNGRAHGP